MNPIYLFIFIINIILFIYVITRVSFLRGMNISIRIYFPIFLFLIYSISIFSISKNSSFSIILQNFAYQSIISIIFIIFFTVTFAGIDKKLDIFKITTNGINWLLLLNIALWLSGVHHNNEDYMPQLNQYNSMFDYFGMYFDRAVFPLSSSVQHFSIYPALLLTICIVNKRNRSLFKIANSIVALVLLDVRSSILAPFIALSLFWIFKRFGIFRPHFIAIVSLLIPIFILFLNTGQDFESFISRNDTSTILSNRELIWGANLDSIGRSDLFHFVFGNGPFGQFSNGSNLEAERLFVSHSEFAQLYFSTHNIYLQLLADWGILGVLIFIVVIMLFYAPRFSAASAASENTLYSACIFLTFMIVSSTEVLLLPYSKEGGLCLLLIFMVGVCPSYKTAGYLGG